MENINKYIIAKPFYQTGSYAYKCEDSSEAHYIIQSLKLLRNKEVQIVVLTDINIYAEYAPFTFIDSPNEFIASAQKL